ASWQRCSSPLDAAQKAARPRGVDIDKVGARIGQRPLDQRIDLPPVADIAEIVEAEIPGIVGADRDEPIAHDLREPIEVLERGAGSCQASTSLSPDASGPSAPPRSTKSSWPCATPSKRARCGRSRCSSRR